MSVAKRARSVAHGGPSTPASTATSQIVSPQAVSFTTAGNPSPSGVPLHVNAPPSTFSHTLPAPVQRVSAAAGGCPSAKPAPVAGDAPFASTPTLSPAAPAIDASGFSACASPPYLRWYSATASAKRSWTSLASPPTPPMGAPVLPGFLAVRCVSSHSLCCN